MLYAHAKLVTEHAERQSTHIEWTMDPIRGWVMEFAFREVVAPCRRERIDDPILAAIAIGAPIAPFITHPTNSGQAA